MNSYARAAVRGEIQRLRGVASGRACAVFRAAAAVGGFVAAREIEWAEAERFLLTAAMETGLSENEATRHIRRGIRRGGETPRSVPDVRLGWGSFSSPACRTSIAASAPVFVEEPFDRPPKTEVDALWSACLPVGSDPEVAGWFGYRYHPLAIVERIELWDLARAIPSGADLPRWAWSRGGSWARTRHRALFRLWDHSGRTASLRARCTDPTVATKSLAPSGFSVKGLVLADPLGVQLLSGVVPDWWEPREIVVAEGEPDWLLWAARQPDAEAQGPACFGIEAGAWSASIAARIPDGSAVVLRSHHDEPGERYAAQIASTLRGRCHLYRSLPEGEANQ